MRSWRDTRTLVWKGSSIGDRFGGYRSFLKGSVIVASFLFGGGADRLVAAADTAPRASSTPITALAFSPDGTALVSNGRRCVDVRSPKDATFQARVPCEMQKITALTFHPSGEILAVSGGEPGVRGEVRLLEWRTRTERQRFTHDGDLSACAAFNANGELFGAASADHHARVWRRADTNGPYSEAFTLSGHAGPVLAMAFSPTGHTLVTASTDRSIKVWSVEDGRLVRTFSHHLEAVNALVFRPDVPGEPEPRTCLCASASDDRTVRVWQPEIGRMVRIIRQHRGPVFAIAYAADGRSLFSAGKEGIIRRFEADSDTLQSEWRGHTDWVYALAISPCGTKLASGDGSGSVQLHDLVEPRGQ